MPGNLEKAWRWAHVTQFIRSTTRDSRDCSCSWREDSGAQLKLGNITAALVMARGSHQENTPGLFRGSRNGCRGHERQ